MASKHVLICNERILFRYGVDRILVELAKKFIAEGWRVTFCCLRSDAALISSIDAQVLTPDLPDGLDLYAVESGCAAFLDAQWEAIEAQAPVSLIVSGGWPFFCTSFVGDKRGIPSIFIDAGAVPHDGLDENAAAPQRAVRRLRAEALPHFDRVLPISRFICESQTIPDRGSDKGVTVVPLGVDHFAALGDASSSLPDADEQRLISTLSDMAARGARLILNLGRFEPIGYKNSLAAFALLRELQSRARRENRAFDARLLLLADEEEASPPADLADLVVCLGKVSDAALAKIMGLSDAGFSPSLWEGFNLPIGEMTILGKPVFAFNIGAHPETVLHPWFLCSGIAEAAEKIDRTLAGREPAGLLAPDRIAAFREAFSWARTLAVYHSAAEDAVAKEKTLSAPERLLFVDVTNASRDTANSGVVRVARRLSAELQKQDAARVLFIYWEAEAGGYRFVSGAREDLLAGYSGPVAGVGRLFDGAREPTPEDLLQCAPGRAGREATLLLAEFIMDGGTAARVDWARAHGMKTAAILYDLIPIDYPHLCGPDVCAAAPAYLEALSRVDSIIAISAYSLGRFDDYLRRRGLSLPPARAAAWLPGQFGATARVRTPAPEPALRAISILCVSTIEPRKNHRALLQAYRQARRALPALDLRLVLIGNSYNGAEALADEVRAAIAQDATIDWRRAVSDEELTAAAKAADFTVYPSLVEGFGLPILESLWLGKPCICHDDGVMAELATGGGCLTVDMNDPAALARAIEQVTTDRSLRDRLSTEARARDIDGWPDYARHVSALLDLTPSEESAQASREIAALARRARQDAQLLQHRLSGIGLIAGGLTPSAQPAPIIVEPPPPPPLKAVAGRNFFGLRWLTARRVRASGLFDSAWYLAQYPDVKAAGMDPVLHFVRFGHLEGRAPGPGFDPARYRADHPELEASGLSAFEYYLRQIR